MMVKQNAAGLANLPQQFYLDLKSDPPHGTPIGGHCPQNLGRPESGVTQKSFENVAFNASKKLSPNFGTGDSAPGFVRLHRASPESDLPVVAFAIEFATTWWGQNLTPDLGPGQIQSSARVPVYASYTAPKRVTPDFGTGSSA